MIWRIALVLLGLTGAAYAASTNLTFTITQPTAGFNMTATYENIPAGTNYDFGTQFKSYANQPAAGFASNGQYIGVGGIICGASPSNPNPGTNCSTPTKWMWSIQQTNAHGAVDANHPATGHVLQALFLSGWTMNGGPGSNPPGAPAGYGSFPGVSTIYLPGSNQSYADVINVEFDWQWGPGFHMTACGGGSKFGAEIGYTWQGAGGQYEVANINLFQPPSTGIPHGGTSYNQFSTVGLNGTGPPGSNDLFGGGGSNSTAIGQWVHVKIQLARGAPNLSAGTGYIKAWENGILIFQDVTRNGIVGNQAPITIPESATPFVAVNGWLGGGTCPATVDSYMLYDNIRVWTGKGP